MSDPTPEPPVKITKAMIDAGAETIKPIVGVVVSQRMYEIWACGVFRALRALEPSTIPKVDDIHTRALEAGLAIINDVNRTGAVSLDAYAAALHVTFAAWKRLSAWERVEPPSPDASI